MSNIKHMPSRILKDSKDGDMFISIIENEKGGYMFFEVTRRKKTHDINGDAFYILDFFEPRQKITNKVEVYLDIVNFLFYDITKLELGSNQAGMM